MRVGFYQFNPVFGKKDANLKKAASAIKDADIGLLVLPEFFATGYQFVSKDEVKDLSEPVPKGYTTEFLSDLSHENGIHIVGGLPERSRGRLFYNSAVLTGPEGFIGVYRKTHLYFEEKLYFSPGNTGFRVWDIKPCRIGIMICFDWFFPESMRTLSLKGAEVIAHPANLVLPYCPQAMPIRCLENRVYAVTANRIGLEKRKDEPLKFIGQSRIVSPHGEVLASAPKAKEALMSVDIEPHSARDKRINRFNDLFKDRRPRMYKP